MSLLKAFSDEIAAVVERTGPSVIHVRALRGGGRQSQITTGSGVLAAPRGYARTNSHVVHLATAVEATLSDGRTATADVVGSDPATDLALLRLDARAPLTHGELGDSSALRVGEFVIAVGAP